MKHTSKVNNPITSEAKFTHTKKDKGPASFFCREAEVLLGALKTKSCLSVASSFCLAEKSAGVGKKMQTANFLFASFFFCSCKRKMMEYIHKKKEGYLPRHPIFINLKSKTMKNTVQIYGFYVI